MSKERELLRRLVHWCWQVGTIPVVLHEEIEELLAQPEQEKEPVACNAIPYEHSDTVSVFNPVSNNYWDR